MRLMTLSAVVVLMLVADASAQTKRALMLDDHSRIIAVADPHRSPDGDWVAYAVTTIDVDKRNTDIWMAKWDGSTQLQLTSSPDTSASGARD